MTISFLMAPGSQIDSQFPKYILESSDGAYRRELSAGSDLVSKGHYLQMRFERLKPGRNYTLTRLFTADGKEVVFEEVPLDKIVDQHRPIHKKLENHLYGEFEIDLGATIGGIRGRSAPSASAREEWAWGKQSGNAGT